ncbi:hypothetical protein RRF57_002397 [Xylaria bambusicola]|uniref:ABC transporter domain-containing protein n=1 Tax=Xylaria bambusicola TaxID=326684 RepID=A0AAN7UF76_9PEZI
MHVAAEFQARLSALWRWEVANSLNTQADELNRYTRVVNSACKALRKKKHSEIELERIKTWVLNIGGMIAGVVALFEFRGNKEALVELTLLTIRWRRFTGAIVFFASLSKRTGHQWAKVRNYLDLVSLPCRRDGSQPLKVEGGRIKVKGLCFSYKEHQVLKGIDMDIRPGETAAILGASGMGKSTLFSLLMRLRDIPEGCIWIDNQDIHDVTETSLRESLGLVPQEFQQTGDTIRENIVYGRANASQQEVRDACMKACILDDIEKLPAKYDTPINNMSAGQKQRIGLARILLRNPQILLLDESTSALDANTEYEIKRSLRKHYSKLTTLIIGYVFSPCHMCKYTDILDIGFRHRLSTVKDANHIYVLGNGIIIEHGTHQQLMQKQGTYAGMWSKLQ